MGASPTKLHALRERLAAEFQEIINSKEVLLDKDGLPVRDDEGKLIYKRHSPAMYNTIRQFLKDNGIDREPLDGAYDKPPVIEALPFQGEEVPQHLLPGGDDAA